MLSIKKGDILVRLSGLIGERGAKPIKDSLVLVDETFPCTCAPHHAVVLRANKPPVCVDLRAGNVLVLPPEQQNLPVILGGKR
jgi:hypothetical protein